MNPQHSKTRIIHIRSKDCLYLNGSNDNIIYNLKEAISIGQNEDCYIQILSASIPYSFYSVNYSNQWLDIEETLHGEIAFFSIQIEEGNYNIRELIQYIQSKLNSSSPNHDTYTLTYDKIKNKVSIIHKKENLTSKILFETGEHSLFSCEFLLGYNSQDYTIHYDIPISSPNVVNLIPYESLYITSNLGVTNNYDSRTKSTSNIIAKIPISTTPYSYIQYDDLSRNKIFLTTSKIINSINLAIVDFDYFPIDLNSVDWFISLKLEIHDKNEDTFELRRNTEELPVEVIN